MLKNKFFSNFLILSAILIAFYSVYKSEIIFVGSFRDYYLPYYILSISILIFAILIRYIDDLIYSFVIIIFNTFIILLFSFEFFLQYNPNFYWSPSTKVVEFSSFVNLKKKKLYKSRTSKNYDFRTKIEVFNEFKKKNESVVVIVPPASHIGNVNINPLSGISNSETIVCNENGYFSIIKSDRYGFNNPDEEWEKENNKYLLVGDSFTYGACVNRPYDMGSVLRNYTNKSVLNLGYPGNGPFIQYATLREYLDTKTEHVLFFFFEENDLEDSRLEVNSKILKKYTEDLNFSQNLKLNQKYIDIINKKKIITSNKKLDQKKSKFDFKKFLKLYEVRSLINLMIGNKLSNKYDFNNYLDDYRNILKLTKNLTEEKNSTLHLVYLPGYPRYKYDYNKDNVYEKIKNIAQELEINFIDIKKEVFDKEENPLRLFPFEFYGHYNIDGYKKVATKINELIESYDRIIKNE